MPADRRGPFFGSGQSASTYGYGRPYPGAAPLLYGFWPLTWDRDVADGQPADNATRPGGPLLSAGLQAPNNTGATYAVMGDDQSVNDLWPSLGQDCAVVNASVPADGSDNQTVQLYREASFALYRFGGSNVSSDANFETCLNQSIGNNLLVAQAPGVVAPLAFACAVAVCVGLRHWR